MPCKRRLCEHSTKVQPPVKRIDIGGVKLGDIEMGGTAGGVVLEIRTVRIVRPIFWKLWVARPAVE